MAEAASAPARTSKFSPRTSARRRSSCSIPRLPPLSLRALVHSVSCSVSCPEVLSRTLVAHAVPQIYRLSADHHPESPMAALNIFSVATMTLEASTPRLAPTNLAAFQGLWAQLWQR
ncbi:hypothetical protein PsYK624_136560 [Phanerochaete sordida]|uniref:Uncharacterized protein n=1 Tax=Phanerochaete sordida TaxID=48140 RepID=A0A9P3LKN7_9APHY|nr:hypothetical protein PsYK624_136560 [Phanerochaete sordida]